MAGRRSLAMLTQSEQSDAILREAMERSDQRFTAQRAAVFRFLHVTDTHPTADDVYRIVRGDLPGISLGTVYKSLETLVGCGLARKLTAGNGSARYDGRMDPHYHARCLECGRLRDVPGPAKPESVVDIPVVMDGFAVTELRLEVVGYCEGCRG